MFTKASLIVAFGATTYSASALSFNFNFGRAVSGSTLLHPNGNNAKCLEAKGSSLANGTPVAINDCNGKATQDWVLSSRTTQVKLAGTDFCLDAGSKPGDRVQMKLWKCYDNLPAQTWYATDDKRIALKDKG
ncbi:hypothetical protein ONZ45_g14514 [Pleurotus djamor]|nr:hypothetical protein ONZ45_g14514 [Pleurotus djamor]